MQGTCKLGIQCLNTNIEGNWETPKGANHPTTTFLPLLVISSKSESQFAYQCGIDDFAEYVINLLLPMM